MKLLKNTIGFCLSLCFFAPTLQASQLTFGNPQFNGPGCSSNDTRITIGDDAIDITFNNYSVKVGGNTGELIDSVDCNIDIPLRIPRGYSAIIDRVEYSGFAILPEEGSLLFSADFYLSNRRGVNLTQEIQGPYFDTFFTDKNTVGQTRINTSCNERSLLRIISDLQLQTNHNFDEAEAAIGRLNVSGRARYYYRMTPCF